MEPNKPNRPTYDQVMEKIASADDVQLTEEERLVHLEGQRERILSPALEASERRADIEDLGFSLELNLANYMCRPDADPRVLEVMRSLISSVSHRLGFGLNTEPLGPSHLNQVLSGLEGAALLIDPTREVENRREVPANTAQLLEKFVNDVRAQVGKVGADGSIELERLDIKDNRAAPQE